ncbi:MAG TPA: kelch repeat-containing protein [Stellaceae bacterium]|nr:kelch repeat-containing protein [Stellaceae bacterium]
MRAHQSQPLSLAAAIVLALVQAALADDGAPGRWRAEAALPEAMDEVGGAAVGGKVYVIGGQTKDADHSPLVAEYDPASNRWRSRAAMPEGLSHPGVTALDGKIYVMGGFLAAQHGRARDDAFVYDPATDRWRALPTLSSPRGSVAAAALGGKIHVIGGRGLDNATVATHEVFDPATARWSVAAPLPFARDHAGIAVLDGKIHIFGGRTADGGFYSVADHDVYDPKSDTWSKAAPLPVARSSGAYTVLDDRILYAGGECRPRDGPRGGEAFDDVTAYDATTDRWTTLAPLPGARHAFAAATVGDVAYFMAGAPSSGDAHSADLLAFRLP